MPILLIFIAVPFIEMFLLIKVGQQIGAINTLLLVVATAVIGVALLKRQGSLLLNRAAWRLDQGQLPATEMAEGLALAFAGALLLTPGFATDALGFLLLLPGTRQALLKSLMRHVKFGALHTHQTHYTQRTYEGEFQHTSSTSDSSSHDAKVLEGEVVSPTQKTHKKN
ncbi:UPF0716 protein FxsA [Allopseudospirillum japonicum]|uniref:UPF0716 protein FxsA n=1 Tax=Allopseudospirillum japonicum TaxID=64971 RepID=A0A1H6RX09_9GAMM|nr:FxsA family protein [Allopseudospirillum japonicum]SEI60271.1 UPF0716 protein FxsA [Allopseudospirillum japonicum]